MSDWLLQKVLAAKERCSVGAAQCFVTWSCVRGLDSRPTTAVIAKDPSWATLCQMPTTVLPREWNFDPDAATKWQ